MLRNVTIKHSKFKVKPQNQCIRRVQLCQVSNENVRKENSDKQKENNTRTFQ